jgi:origin recognition complex subunit 3
MASHWRLFESLRVDIQKQGLGPAVVLTSASSFNLKAVMKRIIQDSTTIESSDADDVDNRGVSSLLSLLRSAFDLLRLQVLNYDFRILEDYVRRNNVERVTIIFQDSDAFDGSLLSDLVYRFRYDPHLTDIFY